MYPPEDERRLALALELADAYHETGDQRFVEVLDAARAAADPITRARASAARAAYGTAGHGELTREERAHLREDARAVFEAESHEVGLAEYWRAVAWEAWVAGKGADSMSACEQALAHLERAHALQSRLASSVRYRLRATAMYAPLPVDEALRRLRALATQDRHPLALAQQRLVEGRLLGMKGEAERARELVGGARQMYAEAGALVAAGGMALSEAELELELGDLERAESILLDGLDLLERIGDRNYYPTLAVMLAEVLLHQHRLGEVSEWLDRSRATTGADDVVNFLLVDALEGTVLAHEGRHEEGEASGRRAVELADTTDYVYARPAAHSYLAETLALGGKTPEAVEHATTAMEILDAKGNVMLAARLRERLAAVGVDV
jgi:tetratricopeptide (TPR) repeat protein